MAGLVRDLGIPVAGIPSTDGSLRLHPWHTTRGVVDLGRAARSIRRLARRVGADLVHANSIRAGLSAVYGTRAGNPPTVVHVRDCLPPSRVASLAQREIGRRAAVVLPNSHYTEARFRRAATTARTHVVHSPIDVERFDPAAVERSAARAQLGLDPSAFVLAVVAQVSPWKGQDDAIRILGHLAAREPSAHLVLVGSPKFVSNATRYDNLGYARVLERLAGSLGLSERVTFLGERDDVPQVLRATDVLLVPSWEEPFGRSIVEGMAMQVPVVATNVGGPAEIVRPGEDGLLLEPRAPEQWARAVEGLMGEPRLRAEMGRNGRERALGLFGVEPHVRGVLAAYEEALSRRWISARKRSRNAFTENRRA
jgi:glycosyltransferase involved in cell wall biosynthesis